MKSIAFVALSAVGLTVFGETWYPGSNWNKASAFSDQSQWVNGAGEQKAGVVAGDALVESDDYVVASGTLIQAKPVSTDADFGGNSLVIGDASTPASFADLYGTANAGYVRGGLVLANGLIVRNGASTVNFQGRVTVTAPTSKPFGVIGQQASSRVAFCRPTEKSQVAGAFVSAPGTEIVFGAGSEAKASKLIYSTTEKFQVQVYGSATDFLGELTVLSKFDNDAAYDYFGTRFEPYMSPAELGGKVNLRAGGAILLSQTNLTLGGLELDEGAKIFTTVTPSSGTCNGLTVTNALVQNGAVHVLASFKHVNLATDVRCRFLTAPKGVRIDESKFVFVPDPQYEASAGANHPQRVHFEVETTDDVDVLYLVVEAYVMTEAPDPNSKWLDVSGSAFTNAASWSDGLVPHAGANYAVAHRLRLTFDDVDYTFPGRSLLLIGSEFHLYGKRTVTIPVLEWQNGEIWTGEGSDPTLAGTCLKTFSGAPETIRTFDGIRLKIAAPLTGDGTIVFSDMKSPGSTARASGGLEFRSLNNDFTGAIQLTRDYTLTGDYRAPVQTLYVTNGRNLGGVLETANPAALKLGAFGCLRAEADVTLDAATRRGLTIDVNGALAADAGKTLRVEWPLTVSGTLHKTGAGTVELAGPVSVADEGFVEVHEGALTVATTNCVDGLSIRVDATGAIVVPFAPSDPGLAACGLYNVITTAHPFTLGEGVTKLPIRFDRQETLAEHEVRTNVLMTVANAQVESVQAILPRLHPYSNAQTRIETTPCGTDATTLLCVSAQAGLIFTVR